MVKVARRGKWGREKDHAHNETDSWHSVMHEVNAEHIKRAEEIKIRKMHKVIKGHYKRVLAERNRTLFARSLAAKRKNFLKDAHKFRLKQSVLSVLEIIPKENLHELRIKLGYNVPAASVQSIPQALVDRIVFLPPNEFTNLATMWGLHPKRNTPAIALANYAFLNAKFCDMRWVKENAVHEVTHLVCSLLKKHANPKYQEALPVALELFSTLEETNRIRQHALAKAERTYVGKFDSREYVHGVNQGKKIFLTAYDLMKTHGREAAIEFFQDLFLSDTLSDNAINNAVKFVKENLAEVPWLKPYVEDWMKKTNSKDASETNYPVAIVIRK